MKPLVEIPIEGVLLSKEYEDRIESMAEGKSEEWCDGFQEGMNIILEYWNRVREARRALWTSETPANGC